ncbi:MAG: hypothetical protein IPN71_08890 [Fibrobacteres bacterium]|nr:hypothetical protein [Fibrobacterota bacterium]
MLKRTARWRFRSGRDQAPGVSSIYTDMALRRVAIEVVQIAAGGMMSRYLKAGGTLWGFVTAGSIDESDVVSVRAWRAGTEWVRRVSELASAALDWSGYRPSL